MKRILRLDWRRVLMLLLAAFLVGGVGFGASDGFAADKRDKPKPQTKKVKAVGQWAYKRLNAAHEALAEEKYGEATEELNDMKGNSKLNEHEQALMWQTFGYVYSAQAKYKQSIDAFEKCLALGGLPDVAQLNTQYNLAQLYVVREKYKQAAVTFGKWMAATENPPAEAHYMYAIPLLQLGRKKEALVQAEKALAKAKTPKEPWLQLALSLYFENKRYRDAAGVLEILVTRFPKKAYWMQLSAVYSELNQHKRALGALEMAYLQGMLKDDRELTNLAQLYLYNEVPYKAARVLEKAMAEGKVKGNAKSWELLANAWLNARERDKALRPLEKAAALSSKGQLYLRLAQVQIDREQWGPARGSLAKALSKGGLPDRGGAQFLLGIAAVSGSQWTEAEKAFEASSEYEDRKAASREWLAHIEQEKEAEAEEAAELAAAAEAEAAAAAVEAATEEGVTEVIEQDVEQEAPVAGKAASVPVEDGVPAAG
ncbi:MAG: tetratricopeptide repeat protein [Candidatus Binatia bacterium]|nr:tetratricopeptide repeat protein [Candidatus Binatia bacterium]